MTTFNNVSIQWVAQSIGDGSDEIAFFVGETCVHTFEDAADAVFAAMKDAKTNTVDVFGEVGEYYTASSVMRAIQERYASLAEA